MLDNFPAEDPIVHVEKKSVELEGFISEAAFFTPAATSPVTTDKSVFWRRIGSPTAWLSTAGLCGALTIGAVAMPLRSVPPQLGVPELQHARVFVPKTLVQFPAAQRTRLSTSPVLPMRKLAPKEARRAKVLAPPKPEVRVAHVQPVAPSVPIAPTNSVRVPTPQPAIAAAASIARPVPAEVVRPVSEEAAVRTVLEMYRGAYQQLDARAARRVWPSLDERRLARAFSGLESQTLEFEECHIDVGRARGVAQCRGRATYVGRVGNRIPETQKRSWTFQLLKTGESWAIDSVRSQ
jgi:hypothetical protein